MENNFNLEWVITLKDNATKPFKKVTNTFLETKKKIATGIWNISYEIWTKLVNAAKVATVAIWWIWWFWLKLAWDFEQTRTAIETMLKDWEKAWKLLKDLSDFAQSTPFEFPEIANAWKSLLAFWFEAKNIQENLRRLWDVASWLNIPLWELSEIYWKARVQWRLFAEDINQLTWRWIPIIQELANVMWTTENNIKDMVEKWKIWFPELEQAFKNMTDEGWKFAWWMEKQSKTLNWLLSTAKDWLTWILREMIWINSEWEIVSWTILDRAKWVLTWFINFLETNKENIKKFSDTVFSIFWNFIETVINIFDEWYKILTENNSISLETIKQTIENILIKIKEFWDKYWNDIITIVQFLWDRISLIIESVINNIVPIVQWFSETIWNIFKLLWSLIKLDFWWSLIAMQWIFIWVKDTLIAGANLLLDIFANIFWVKLDEILLSAWQFFENFRKVIEEIFNSIKKIIEDTISYINWIIESAMNKITWLVNSVSNAFNSVKNLWNSIWNSISWAIWNIWFKAMWWPVNSNTPYIVWEKWPELFVPNSSWNIIPNNKLSWWWNNINVSINMWWISVRNNNDIDNIVDKIKQVFTRDLQLNKYWITN